MEILREYGLGMENACGGALACAECHVILDAEWAWRVPQSLKIDGAIGKVLLRRTFADLIPPAILARDKVGFAIGGGGRFSDDVGRQARRLLVDERALDGLVDGAEVARIVRRHGERTENLMEPLLALIVLALWRRIFVS